MTSQRVTSCLLLMALLATAFAGRVPAYASILSEVEAKECVEGSATDDKQVLALSQFESACFSANQIGLSTSWKALSNSSSPRRSLTFGLHVPARGPPSCA